MQNFDFDTLDGPLVVEILIFIFTTKTRVAQNFIFVKLK